MLTHTGLQILTKALLPFPEKWHGLSDAEKRYRQRYAQSPPGVTLHGSRPGLISSLKGAMPRILCTGLLQSMQPSRPGLGRHTVAHAPGACLLLQCQCPLRKARLKALGTLTALPPHDWAAAGTLT